MNASPAATKAITYKGGAGVDRITINNANANQITTGDGGDWIAMGDGNNVINVGNGNNTIDTGSGNDNITVGTGSNTINSGAGNDVIRLSASTGLNKIDVGAGTDTIILWGAPVSAGAYASVTGMTAGDKIDFHNFEHGNGVLGAKLTLGGADTLATYLAAATADSGSINTALAWFQLNGNTYLTFDNSASATFNEGADAVIELVGLVDLSTTLLGGNGTIVLA